MIPMRALLTITHLTLHEAGRRRILLAALLCGIAFLVLFGIGFHFVVRDLPARVLADTVRRRIVLTFFALAGLYATNFLTAMTAVLLPVDTLSGEIGSGVMQTIASKPIRRSQIVLGKWLAFVIMVTAYLTLLAGGVLAIVRLRGGLTLDNVPLALPLMLLEAVVLLTLSIACGTRFSTVTNGVAVFGLYGLAFLGGWVEQIGTYAGNDTARTIGTVASLVMPSESLWQLAAWHLQPPIVRAVGAGPFAYAAVPTPAMVWWAAGYVVVVMAVALRTFAKRPL
jgi:ABC-type transport system involved in multi-copper enzyme maturation permease subunit